MPNKNTQEVDLTSVIPYFDDYEQSNQASETSVYLSAQTIELSEYYQNAIKDINLSNTKEIYLHDHEAINEIKNQFYANYDQNYDQNINQDQYNYQQEQYNYQDNNQEEEYYQQRAEAFYNSAYTQHYQENGYEGPLFTDHQYQDMHFSYDPNAGDDSHVYTFTDGRERLFSDSVIDPKEAEKTAEYDIENFIRNAADKKAAKKKAKEEKKRQKEEQKRRQKEEAE